MSTPRNLSYRKAIRNTPSRLPNPRATHPNRHDRNDRPRALQLACILSAACGLGGGAAAAHGESLHVPGQFATIQEAVNAAQAGDTILVAPGSWHGFAFLGKDVIVRSTAGAEETTIISTIVATNGETDAAAIDGFTVTVNGGTAPGVQLANSDIRIMNSIITGNNNTWGGGGIDIIGGAPVISDTIISGNTSGAMGLHFAGGGGISAVDSEVMLINCIIRGNSTAPGQAGLHAQLRHDGGHGGGAYFRDSQVTLVACTITGNTTGDGGDDDGCDTFNRNQPGTHGGSGGGIFLENSQAMLVNCIIAGNDTGRGGNGGECPPTPGGHGGSGGAIHAQGGGTLYIINCTLADNAVGERGSGPAGAGNDGIGGGIAAADAQVEIYNTILWSNQAPGVEGTAAQKSLPANAVIESSCIMGLGMFDSNGNFGLEPMFVDAGEGDYRLVANSPCIDAGDNGWIPEGLETDVAGLPRFHDDPESISIGRGETSVIDIGAHEFQGVSCYANCDGSTDLPLLNVNDFICFMDRFAMGDPRANCDGSTTEPVLNVEDFTCFVARFIAGCED